MFLNQVFRNKATLKDVSLNITDGVHNTVQDDANGEYYLLSCKNIKGGVLSIGNNERRINKDTFDKLRKRTKLEKGDILLSSVGTVGELLILKREPTNFEFQRSVAIIKPNHNIVSSFFIYEALHSQITEIKHLAHGAVQQCLFIGDISNIQIPLPTKEELEKFNKYVQPMFDLIAKNEEENAYLVSLQNILLPQLMSGEIDVSSINL